MADVTASLRAETTNAPTRDAAIDGTVPSLAGRGLIESVSDITGLAVVARARAETRAARGRGRGRRIARKRWRVDWRRVAQDGEAARARAARAPRDDSDEVRTDVIVDDVEALRQIREALASGPARVTDFFATRQLVRGDGGAASARFSSRTSTGYPPTPPRRWRRFWRNTYPRTAAARTFVRSTFATSGGTASPSAVRRDSPDRHHHRRRGRRHRRGTTAAGFEGGASRNSSRTLLQLALYQWLDAFGRVQGASARPRAGKTTRRDRHRNPVPPAGSRPGQGQTRVHRRGSLGSARTPGPVREGWRRRVQDASSGDAAERANGFELRADARTLTRAVLTLVDHRLRSDAAATNDEFLAAAEAAGAATHAPNAEGRVRRDAGAEQRAESAGSKDGGGERRLPKAETNDADGDEAESMTTTTKATRATRATKATKATTTRAKATKAKSSAGFVFVGGKTREADLNRRALVGGRASTARPSPRGETVVGYRRRRVRRGGCLLTAAGENTSVARRLFFYSFRRRISHERRALLRSPRLPRLLRPFHPLLSPREEHGVQAAPPDGSTTTTGRISQLFGHPCVSALTSGEHPSWSVAPNSLSIAAMNALCVTTATCCSGRRITHSMNLCARSHIASLDSFMVPQRTSFSSVTSEKSTPGKASRYARVSRRRSHGLEADVFAAQLAREEGSGARVRVARAGDGGMTGADAILGSGGAHQQTPARPTPLPGSIPVWEISVVARDVRRRGRRRRSRGRASGVRRRRARSCRGERPYRRAWWRSRGGTGARRTRSQPRGVKCASANCSDR